MGFSSTPNPTTTDTCCDDIGNKTSSSDVITVEMHNHDIAKTHFLYDGIVRQTEEGHAEFDREKSTLPQLLIIGTKGCGTGRRFRNINYT